MISYELANLLLNRPNNKIDNSIISIDQIRIIISLLDTMIKNNISGDVVEFGCYVGESSKYLRMTLDYHLSNKNLIVYDSFEGLPSLSTYEENTGWRSGTLKTSKDILISNFISNGLKQPSVVKGWFNDISPEYLPNTICFGFLDGDFYNSIFDSLSLVYPRLSNGGCIVFHDYERNDLPGVKAAVLDYIDKHCVDNSEYLLFKIFHELGVLVKLI